MKALVFERSPVRYGAAIVAGRIRPGAGSRIGPLLLTDMVEPELPGPGWRRVHTRLAGICGSDLGTVDGHSSNYFEPLVSFPFVPGHEVVGNLDDHTRVVVEPVLRCAARGISPPCRRCAAGTTNRCERIAFGTLAAGLQTGYCADTGGGWGTTFVAHESQLHTVPDDFSDEAAVMVEPTACAVHAVRLIAAAEPRSLAVIGAGTLGLCTLAAVEHLGPSPDLLLAAAKHPEQRAFAAGFGARVVQPDELDRAVRAAVGGLRTGPQLTDGVDVVADCVGSEASLAQALRIVAPGGTIVLVGMAGRTTVDLTPLWHREVVLRGAYAYTTDDFRTAFDVVRHAELGRLVSALYTLDHYREAIEHAAEAGRRGAVKVAFDLRKERR